jgi:hypothetical protein
MGRFLTILLLVVLVVAAAMLGQAAGFYDVPVLRGVQALLPFSRQPQASAVPTPQPAEPLRTPAPTSVSSVVPAKPTEECTAASPRFVHGAAALKAALGAPMGEAVECERVIDTNGNTEQKTTVGLAYYRAQSNIAAFTNGFDHWALTPNGLVHWTSDEVDPPPNAEPAG